MKKNFLILLFTVCMLWFCYIPSSYAWTEEEWAEYESFRQQLIENGVTSNVNDPESWISNPGYEFGGLYNPNLNPLPLPGESNEAYHPPIFDENGNNINTPNRPGLAKRKGYEQYYDDLCAYIVDGQYVRGHISSPPTGYTATINWSTVSSTSTTHTHEYEEQIIKEATCIEKGTVLYKCSCGKEYTETIELSEHVYEEFFIEKVATCMSSGFKIWTCKYCANEKREEIKPIGHEESDWVEIISATCTSKGEEQIHCVHCGEVLQKHYIDKTEHSASDNWEDVTKPTLFESGEKQLKCLVCEEVISVEIIPCKKEVFLNKFRQFFSGIF